MLGFKELQFSKFVTKVLGRNMTYHIGFTLKRSLFLHFVAWLVNVCLRHQ